MLSTPFFVAIAIIFDIGTNSASADLHVQEKASYLDDVGFRCFKVLGKCFKVNFENKKYQDALEYCLEHQNATLASIHFELENQLIMDLITRQIPADQYFELWIGMQLTRHSKAENRIIAATWQDGSRMDYGNPIGIVPGTAPWANTDPQNRTIRMEEKIVLKFGAKDGSTLTAIYPIPASCAKNGCNNTRWRWHKCW